MTSSSSTNPINLEEASQQEAERLAAEAAKAAAAKKAALINAKVLGFVPGSLGLDASIGYSAMKAQKKFESILNKADLGNKITRIKMSSWAFSDPAGYVGEYSRGLEAIKTDGLGMYKQMFTAASKVYKANTADSELFARAVTDTFITESVKLIDKMFAPRRNGPTNRK
jgi:hypothetical protein